MTGHKHAAGDINSGQLGQAYGGTGKNSLYKIYTFTGKYGAAIASGGYKAVNVSNTSTPASGYSPVAVLQISTGRERVTIVNFNISSTTAGTVGVRNDSGTSASDATVTVRVLFLPTAS